MQRLSNQQITEAGLADWRRLAQALHARFRHDDPAVAAGFLARMTTAVEHRPEARLTGGVLDLTLATREDGVWITEQDVAAARAISALAAEAGLHSDPAGVTQLELALDTAHEDRLGPIWSVLLTGSPDNKVYDSVFDPTNRVPSLWFQPSEPGATPPQRWHFDIWLAPEVVDERIAAAVAAGATIDYDAAAPAFTILADPDGNRVCVCCSTGRD